MGVLRYILPVMVGVVALYVGGFLSSDPQPPSMEDGWWGKGQQTQDKGESEEGRCSSYVYWTHCIPGVSCHGVVG